MKKSLFVLILTAVLFPIASQAQRIPKAMVIDSISTCDSLTWIDGIVYHNDTNLFYSVPETDTLRILVLKINHSSYAVTEPVSRGCEYVWHNRLLNETGIYFDTVTNAVGCDSITELSLTITGIQRDTLDEVEACVSYTWNDETLTESGYYSKTTEVETLNCDSVIVLPLTITSTIHMPTDSVSACGQYEWHDSIYVETGVHTLTLSDATVSCDTLYKLALVIDTVRDTLQAYTACSSYTWTIGSESVVATDSNLYFLEHRDASNCLTISYRQINIVPLRSVSDTIDTVSCGKIMYRFEGETVRDTRTILSDQTIEHTIQFRTAERCVDSLSVVNCIVKPIKYENVVATECNHFTWNGTTYTNSTNDSLVMYRGASNGCDSIIRINIVINPNPVITSIEGRLQMEEPGSTRLNAVCDQPNVEYSWDVRSASGNNTYDGDTLDLTVSTTTDILLTVTNTQTGCESQQWLVVVVGVGIEDAGVIEVSIYPNPTTRTINIACDQPVREAAIFNTIGQMVEHTVMNGTNTVDVASLAKGSYMLRLTLQDGQTVSRKFIVSK